MFLEGLVGIAKIESYIIENHRAGKTSEYIFLKEDILEYVTTLHSLHTPLFSWRGVFILHVIRVVNINWRILPADVFLLCEGLWRILHHLCEWTIVTRNAVVINVVTPFYEEFSPHPTHITVVWCWKKRCITKITMCMHNPFTFYRHVTMHTQGTLRWK